MGRRTSDPSTAGHRQRLRQRFLNGGGHALADYELLEMMLFAAMPRGDAKPLAKRLIAAFGSLAEVVAASPQQLQKIDDMGEAATAAVKVAEAVALKLGRAEVLDRPVISNWERLVSYCMAQMARAPTERFRVLFLNKKNVLIADEEQQRGTVDHTPVYPREVVKRALELGATALIMVHNHPSGDPTPSRADIEMTHEIRDTAARLDIVLHDHLIVARSGCNSFRTMGLL